MKLLVSQTFRSNQKRESPRHAKVSPMDGLNPGSDLRQSRPLQGPTKGPNFGKRTGAQDLGIPDFGFWNPTCKLLNASCSFLENLGFAGEFPPLTTPKGYPVPTVKKEKEKQKTHTHQGADLKLDRPAARPGKLLLRPRPKKTSIPRACTYGRT